MCQKVKLAMKGVGDGDVHPTGMEARLYPCHGQRVLSAPRFARRHVFTGK
jgi:hypothetical protein